MTAGHFGQISLFCHCVPYWNYHISMGHGIQLEGRGNVIAYEQGLNTIEFRICSSGSSGVLQLLVRFMIPPFAPHAPFCPLRVVIPSVNSKQPVRQQAKSQGRGPDGISRAVNRDFRRRNCQGFLPSTVARDGQCRHFGVFVHSLDHHHAEAHGDPWESSTCEPLLDSE